MESNPEQSTSQKSKRIEAARSSLRLYSCDDELTDENFSHRGPHTKIGPQPASVGLKQLSEQGLSSIEEGLSSCNDNLQISPTDLNMILTSSNSPSPSSIRTGEGRIHFEGSSR